MGQSRQQVLIERLFHVLIPNLKERGLTPDEMRHALFAALLSFFVAPLIVFLTILEYLAGHYDVVALEVMGTVLLLLTFVLVRKGVAPLPIARVCLLFFVCLIFYVVWIGNGSSTLYYLVVIPLITVFEFGMIEGSIWALTSLLLFNFINRIGHGFDTIIEDEYIYDFVIIYIITYIFAVASELLRARAEQKAIDQLKEMETTQFRLVDSQAGLEVSEQRYRRLVDLASDWVFELDANLTYKFISQRWELVSGTPIDSIIGRSVMDDLPKYQDCDIEQLKALLNSHQTINSFSYSLQSRSRTRISILINAEPVYNEKGVFDGYLGTGSEVTDYEQQVRIMDKKLHDVQKLDAVGQLSSGIAHDFNNLLTVIRGNMEVIKHRSGQHIEAELLDPIFIAIDSASGLTSNLLSYARGQPLQKESLELVQFLVDLEPLIRRTIGHGIHFNVNYPKAAWVFVVDRSLLEAALINLVTNAIEAMDGEGVLTLEVRVSLLHAEDESGEFVELVVSDDGCGIPKQIRDKVLDPFFSTKSQSEGAGLGLSMAYGFAMQSGGRLTVNSVEKVGTKISMLLPQAEEEEMSNRVAGLQQDQVTGSLKVLVVEDEQSVQKVINRMLQMQGHETLLTSDAEQALAQISDFNPDLVISDIMLGTGMNGLDLASKLRRDYPTMKVALMSGYADEILIQQNQSGQNYELLQKPFGLADLLTFLERVG